MKKFVLPISLSIAFCSVLQAQQRVGINVAAPTENLHVDSTIKVGKSATLGTLGRKNLIKFGDANYVTIGEEQADDKLYIRYGDLVFAPSGGSGNGNIGIKTETPTADFHVNGTFRLEGNGAGAGKVLTSDASGNATWQASSNSDIYAVGSTDFRSAAGSPTVYVSGGSGGAYYNSAYFGSLVAPVHLPNGAKVNKIVVWYLDNEAENISFDFTGEYTTASYSGGYTDFATLYSTGAVSNTFRTVTQTLATPIVIDNESYNYQFTAYVHWPGNFSSFAVKSVKFYYTY